MLSHLLSHLLLLKCDDFCYNCAEQKIKNRTKKPKKRLFNAVFSMARPEGFEPPAFRIGSIIFWLIY